MRLLFLLGVSVPLTAAMGGQSIRLRDQSDWWSLCNEKEPALNVDFVKKKFDVNNFKVLGLSLDSSRFDEIASKLGKAKVVERGGASFSRNQICYMSSGNSEPVHLIFEGAEGGIFTFYLFRGGADWNGSSFCVKSDQLSKPVVTGTGLRLGLSRSEVEAILGKPDSAEGDRIAYSREFECEMTQEEFEKSDRACGAPPSKNEARGKLVSFDVTLQIEARFKNGEMNYFFVSTAGS